MTKIERFWEIDLLRGIAIISMIIFHFLFDLNFFNIYSVNINDFPLILFSQPTRIAFLGLVGVSLSLSYSRVKNKYSERQVFLKYLKRGLFIFAGGMFITFLTWFLFDGKMVVFGVLHCIGLSIILSYFFLKSYYANLYMGLVLVVFGFILKQLTFSFDYLFFLGFKSVNFYSLDYFPLLPWFGVVLIGIFFGKMLYPNYVRVFRISDLSSNKLVSFFCLLGRNSLLIYFVHPLILFLIIYVLFLR